MKKQTICITVYLLFVATFGLFAQSDLVVTKQNIWLDENEECLPNNESDGRVTFDASNGSIFPIEIFVMEAPDLGCWGSFIGGEAVETLFENETTGSVLMSCPMKCYGKYCFKAVRADGCEIDFCKTIMYCKEGRTPRQSWCLTNDDIIHARETEEHKAGSIYAAGYSYLLEPDDEIGADYIFYTKISDTAFDAVSEKIGKQIDAVFMEIQEKGYSVYEIESREEFTATGDYIFKFDGSGNIIWMIYNGERKVNAEKKEWESISTKQSISAVSVFPNPFNDEIKIKISSRLKQSVDVSLVDLMGEVAFRKYYVVLDGQNSFVIRDANLVPDGVYVVLIRGEDGFYYSQKIIHHKK